MTARKKPTAVHSSKKSKKTPFFLRLLLILLGLSALLLLFFFIFFYRGLQPVDPNGEEKPFVVNQGDSLYIIASRLEKNNFIKNKFVFLLLTYQQGLQNKLQAGSFNLSPSSVLKETIKTLSVGRQDYWLKVTEGWRIEEIKQYLLGLGFKKEELALLKKETEGTIFPDSYLVPKDYTLENILPLFETNFQKKITLAQENKTSSLNQQQGLILASIIEREARTLETKQMISGILQNRLKIGMALQTDANVQYAKDSQNIPEEYWKPIYKADLSIDSLYNTYLYPDLPPGPICNPGSNSLYAAFHPTSSDYLYYITGNDHKMYYATTLEDHNANIKKHL